jgi:hypothetical protein
MSSLLVVWCGLRGGERGERGKSKRKDSSYQARDQSGWEFATWQRWDLGPFQLLSDDPPGPPDISQPPNTTILVIMCGWRYPLQRPGPSARKDFRSLLGVLLIPFQKFYLHPNSDLENAKSYFYAIACQTKVLVFGQWFFLSQKQQFTILYPIFKLYASMGRDIQIFRPFRTFRVTSSLYTICFCLIVIYMCRIWRRHIRWVWAQSRSHY